MTQVAIKSGYRPQATDTSVEANVFAFALLRQKTVADRVQMGLRLTSWAKAVSLRGMRKAKGAAFGEWFAQSILEDKWLPILTPTSDPTMWVQDPSETARSLRDVLGVLKVQGKTLDFAYLVQWGNELDIAERLAQAFEEAGV